MHCTSHIPLARLRLHGPTAGQSGKCSPPSVQAQKDAGSASATPPIKVLGCCDELRVLCKSNTWYMVYAVNKY